MSDGLTKEVQDAFTNLGALVLELERENARMRAAITAVCSEKWLLDPHCDEDHAMVDELRAAAGLERLV